MKKNGTGREFPKARAPEMKKERKGAKMANVLLVVGLLCILYCVGILFSGAFGSWFFGIWGAMGAAFLVLSQAARTGIWLKIPFACRIVLGAILAAGIVLFLLVEGLIISHFGDSGKKNLDYILVLGAQMRENGPSRALQYRLDTAAAYLKENPDTLVIVSGGQGSNEPVSEAKGMHDYLVTQGIATDRILLEDKSTNTHENLAFSGELLTKETASVGIITNNFHVYRSIQLAKKQEYGNVCGIAAPGDIPMQANNMVREFFGVMKDRLFGNMTFFGK